MSFKILLRRRSLKILLGFRVELSVTVVILARMIVTGDPPQGLFLALTLKKILMFMICQYVVSIRFGRRTDEVQGNPISGYGPPHWGRP